MADTSKRERPVKIINRESGIDAVNRLSEDDLRPMHGKF